MRFIRSAILLLVTLTFISGSVFAEKKLEESIPLPPKNEDAVDITKLKRARITEDQAENQLKYMMVKGFAKVERTIVENNTFPPFGLTLMPDGEFKAVLANTGDKELKPGVQLALMARNMEAMAQTRSVWAVGIMYIRAIKREDGSYAQRIIVMAEHIAGWARHWAYPFKIENGEVKLAQPVMTKVEPIYFVDKNKKPGQ